MSSFIPYNPVDVKNLAENNAESKISLRSQLSKVLPYLHPYRFNQAGIMLSYLDIGIALHIFSAPITYYLIYVKDLPATSVSAYLTLKRLPWSFKFLFGILTDKVPILQYRRKSWLLIAWFIYLATSLRIALLPDPSYKSIAVAIFIMTSSYILAYVCTDTLVVERAKLEPEILKGTIQTSGSTMMTYGMLLGSILGAVLFNGESWGWGLSINNLFFLSFYIPLVTIVPSWWFLDELSSFPKVTSIMNMFRSVYSTLELRAVWRPMIFISPTMFFKFQTQPGQTF